MSPELVLGPMLRHVSRTTATIWVEVSAPCRVEILDATTSTFSVAGHHFALVIVEGLEPGSVHPYEVRLDESVVWPERDSAFPPSSIRTLSPDEPLRMLFGSCRAAAPHEPPWTDIGSDDKARGVDSMRAHGIRMLDQPPTEWPHLLVHLGDQVYADNTSPGARQRIEDRRQSDLPAEIVANFEEYTWLYRESWSEPVERWMFSVVPSAMIFDDHDVLDDWNISRSWVDDIRAEPWWPDHIIGGMCSYWIYQHLGNLNPATIVEEGMLASLIEAGDGTDQLTRWALESEEFTPIPGGYQFTFDRDLGDVHLVVIDARNARVLEPGNRSMVGDKEWDWIVDRCLEPTEHLVIATSLPVFVPGGTHGLQRWNEAICDGERGRLLAFAGEKLRRALDLEDWPAFDKSFRRFVDLLVRVGSSSGDERRPPTTISIISGDIHFAYLADIEFSADNARPPLRSRVHQIVSSPIRNSLSRPERAVIRAAISPIGQWLGTRLTRWAGGENDPLSWDRSEGPVFENNMGMLRFEGPTAHMVLEKAVLGADGSEHMKIVFDRDLAFGRSDATGKIDDQ